MSNKPKVSEQLYSKLPNIYRVEDSRVRGTYPLPLKRFLQVLGTGYDFMEDKIEGLVNLYDIDNCPSEFLAKIVETMGFKFPYALPENEQRRFVKVLPYLYKTKGTTNSFEYLAREIFGTKSSTKAYKQTYKEGMTPREWRTIFVEITTDGEQLNLGRKEEYFRRFSELVRPVNTTLVVLLMIYYSDFYNLKERTAEDENTLKIWDSYKNENYRYNLFINGLDSRIGGHHLILSDDLDYSFLLNKSRLYNNQKIEMRDTIREIILPDLINQSYHEKFDRRSMSDLLLPFGINMAHLGNTNFGIGYYNDFIEKVSDTFKDDLSIIVRDVFNKDTIRVGGEDLDSYRFRSFVDGIDVLDLNKLLLTNNKENPYVLNKDRLFKSQSIINKEVILEEFLTDLIKPDSVYEMFNKSKVNDCLSPFTIGHNTLNSKGYGMEGYINEGTIYDIKTDKYDLKAKDGITSTVLTDDEPLTDSYKQNVLINNASMYDQKNEFILRKDNSHLFKLNTNKTYGIQQVSLVSRISEQSFDLGTEALHTDKIDLKAKDTDYPFVMNRTALNNKNWNLGHELLRLNTITSAVESDEYKLKAGDELVLTGILGRVKTESYKSNTIIDGKSIYDVNNALILGHEDLNSMKLNSARTFGTQSIQVKGGVQIESFSKTTMTPDYELAEKKAKDNDSPFTVNHSAINNIGLQLKFEKGEAEQIIPSDEDNAKRKLHDELMTERYIEVTEDYFDIIRVEFE